MKGGSYHKAKREVERLRRLLIFIRDEHRCAYCDCDVMVAGDSDNKATIDHIWPQHLSKSCDSQTNMTTSCFSCNQKKGGDPWPKFAEENGINKVWLQKRINIRKEKKISRSIWKSISKMNKIMKEQS